MALLLSSLCAGWCAAQTATFVYKNGKVVFGEFIKMAADSLYMAITDNGGGRRTEVIAKNSLSEVVFDSGDKLNLALPEYPPSHAPTANTSSANSSSSSVSASTASQVQVSPPPVRSGQNSQTGLDPFTYGGLSAIVPGLGQVLQKEYAKGAVCFGVVGIAAIGTVEAWNSTTNAYNTLNASANRMPDGSYNTSYYGKFTQWLHGSEALTGVTAVLYLLNIASATVDAMNGKGQLQAGPSKSTLTFTPSADGCELVLDF
jgi:hypothetical protein